MEVILNAAQVEYMLVRLGIESSIDKLLKDEWILTDDKSKDDIRSEDDDIEFPIVVLRNGECFEAITKQFMNDILNVVNMYA